LIDEPGIDEEAGRYLRDVQDHAIRAEEHAETRSGRFFRTSSAST
jgi:hypothetical protein